MNDVPEYSISEFLLAALCFAAALAALLCAGRAWWMDDDPYVAMQGAGLSLALFAGCADPRRYFVDCFTFPFRLVGSAGRETPLTVVAGLLGSGLALTGWGLDWYFG